MLLAAAIERANCRRVISILPSPPRKKWGACPLRFPIGRSWFTREKQCGRWWRHHQLQSEATFT